MSMEDPYIACTDNLRKMGINFVGIDFDQTFISQHTGGHWKGSKEDLAPYARVEFRKLIPVLIDHGINVAIVTFSAQRNLIEGVLRLVLGDVYTDKILIRARDGSWGIGGTRDGKQKYLASAAEEFERLGGIQITRSSSLLIDDDQQNIQIALEKGVWAIWFIPEEPENLTSQILGLKEHM